MNQILETKLNHKIKNKKNSKLLKFQFYISILLAIAIIVSTVIIRIKNSYSAKKSSEILSNYNMMRLYSSVNNYSNLKNDTTNFQNNSGNSSNSNNSSTPSNSGNSSHSANSDNPINSNTSYNSNNSKNNNLNENKNSNLNENKSENPSNIIGTIEIKKISLNYTIFSGFTEELLKTSPCRFFGPNIGEVGNLCIAGHNYDNDKFFSKIPKLKLNDEIILKNSENKSFSYFVKNIYEVNPDDLSPVYDYNKNLRNLTLITCNNFNKNRIIVRAVSS